MGAALPLSRPGRPGRPGVGRGERGSEPSASAPTRGGGSLGVRRDPLRGELSRVPTHRGGPLQASRGQSRGRAGLCRNRMVAATSRGYLHECAHRERPPAAAFWLQARLERCPGLKGRLGPQGDTRGKEGHGRRQSWGRGWWHLQTQVSVPATVRARLWGLAAEPASVRCCL